MLWEPSHSFCLSAVTRGARHLMVTSNLQAIQAGEGMGTGCYQYLLDA